LHFHTGETNLGALLTIEYAFHVTLMIGGAILAYFFFQLARQHSEMNNKSMQ
jgi:threonine/homoserine/homoserine lactone efflux protein